MKPNNLYFKQIAENTTGETYSKLYSSNYYAKKIAEHYNTQYTGRNPLNKYLEDWYTGLTGETEPSDHKPNVWYLRRLAKATDDSINEKILNENQCLHIIADGEPTPSLPLAIEIEITGNTFSSNSPPFTHTGDVIIDWGDGNTETYNDIPISHNYASNDDYTIQIKGNVTALNYGCFANNSTIKVVTFFNDDMALGIGSFPSNSNLIKVVLPKNLTNVSDFCFGGDSKLSDIVIPNTVKTLGENCFTGCSSLTNIIIPQGVTSIGSQCFMGCTGLTSINVPKSVTVLGVNSFDISTLQELILDWESSEEIIPYSISTYPNFKGCTFIIPTGTSSLYMGKGFPSARIRER